MKMAQDIQGRINMVLDELTSGQTTEARDRCLRSMIDQAVDLARLFRIQQAQFKVHMPSLDDDHPLLFDPETMEDISGEDEQALRGHKIDCIMFPCVMKFGDETGDNVRTMHISSGLRLTFGIRSTFET